jgi:hypothetical protein
LARAMGCEEDRAAERGIGAWGPRLDRWPYARRRAFPGGRGHGIAHSLGNACNVRQFPVRVCRGGDRIAVRLNPAQNRGSRNAPSVLGPAFMIQAHESPRAVRRMRPMATQSRWSRDRSVGRKAPKRVGSSDSWCRIIDHARSVLPGRRGADLGPYSGQRLHNEPAWLRYGCVHKRGPPTILDRFLPDH